MENTRDLSQFGIIELKEAGRLLTAYCYSDDVRDSLSNGVVVEFNHNSGKVFLVDKEYNVAMMNGDILELWYSCCQCGHEGFKEDMKHGEDDKECQDYLKQIGVIE